MNVEELIIKQELNYEISLLRNKERKTYKEISTQLKIGVERVRQRNNKFLHDLCHLYVKYLNSKQIEIDYWEIYDFYQTLQYSVAYLEKEYKEYLDSFRHGKPPMIFQSHMDIPPFRELTDKKILELEKSILEAREQQKRTFYDIGKECKLSKEKVRRIYDLYYHKKVIIAYERIKKTGDFSIDKYVYNYFPPAKTKWEFIVSKYGELVKDLID